MSVRVRLRLMLEFGLELRFGLGSGLVRVNGMVNFILLDESGLLSVECLVSGVGFGLGGRVRLRA